MPAPMARKLNAKHAQSNIQLPTPQPRTEPMSRLEGRYALAWVRKRATRASAAPNGRPVKRRDTRNNHDATARWGR
jgi:hypothetical protein